MSSVQDHPKVGNATISTSHEEFVSQGPNRMAVDYSGATPKSDPKEIKLVKKLDLWIMPTLWLMYWLNYLDRNAIALARLDNLEEDLGLQGSQYQTCVSILFVGYLLGQVPSSKFVLYEEGKSS